MHAGASSEFEDALAQIEAAEESDVLQQALTAARERLDMDAAYITTIDTRAQTIEVVIGDSSALGFGPGSVIPIEDTFCRRMLGGEIPSLVADTGTEPALGALIEKRPIGAYVGVPVTLADGRLHGTLCCASSEAKEHLGPEELRFMQVLAGIVAARIDKAQGDLSKLTARLRQKRSG